ncbi:MAG: pyruvate:ferredoxin (flavodoxin) oxidoreductase [Peptoniphilus lacydonensis]|uniref:pyruvate:ferredoxin (flavodoxin) oxidoreductase n=1 Tax=Peptoniphilus TaxID=162289 RepID=UPI000289F8E9|nr:MULTISPECIES: pyruvate:ferredoxin (flavodoxin) oxidoreductase [Peptoniphilus]MDU1954157.1 pyruvate:ferredoxin (flavodoxin) oxidoreductase [Peptoniphilus lacydonensis]MDU2115893.1 pyruvate:ferredoxin (flavodoxin) oxidoreductase [Peptoniphilus lacydonensis]MDU5274667.1 pyruvate:ferredoxin (flavodoxin) oxidoreductase [Peptoniphilus lacydonensis]MDU7301805.1 pyruvate:ferredoxin (flavodoxin) oxidoreductase [Peptoniphilus lacydonensis]
MSKTFKTMDGNEAAAHVAYAFSDVACIYPITPSSPMAEHIDAWASHGRKNIFGQEVMVKELQSEGGAAGAVHGALQAGSLTSTYTASQGLLLMLPNMYKIAGELLPGVFHVAARALASHALSIFGDHQDVMAARASGFALLASGSVQESMDLAGVAHLSSIKGRVPFLHFFDGFRTSHEVQKIEVLNYDDLEKLVDKDAVKEFKERALNPNGPKVRGTAQNPDIYFQEVEASNNYYTDIIDVTEGYMKDISKLTGREYNLFNYYGAKDATDIIVAMGSVTETIEEVVDYLNAKGEKTGLIKVHLYRPFSIKHLMEAIPKTVERIAVLDRTKEKGAVGQPLYLDIRDAFYESDKKPLIVGGIYGLGSKDTNPTDILSVFDNLKDENPKNDFTIGIVDDVTNKSLPIKETITTEPEGTIRCKFWGFGSDGTVGANKSAIKIIGDNTDMYAQGYFDYDSKKSGGVTMSHLRFGKNKITSTYLLTETDFISCSKQSYVYSYDLLRGLKKGGKFLLNTIWDEDELDEHLPGYMKKYIADNEIEFYTINATKIAAEVGLGGRTNMVMQAAFFNLSQVLPIDQAVKLLKEAIVKDYGAKGDDIVRMNYDAVDRGIDAIKKIEVKDSWKDSDTTRDFNINGAPEFINNMLIPMNRQEGNDLPVSAFVDMPDGTFPAGTSRYEKRGIAVNVPHWKIENCIECNQCSLVCPHAVIRPFLVDKDEKKNAPESFETKKANGKGFEDYEYRIQISPLDCTGCGNCAQVCPAKEKALVMSPYEDEIDTQAVNWEYASENIKSKEENIEPNNFKNSQFQTPYLEFSGACAGCGETPYVKLVTQLFGDRMSIANATGCSSIWGGSAPSMPYCTDECGNGPSWANSLFEDNAEYGYGMAISQGQTRDRIEKLMNEFIELNVDNDANEAFKAWIEGKDDYKTSKAASAKVLKVLDKKFGNDKADEIIDTLQGLERFLIKKSQWIIGGDGWAYDIGYGGLDHVLASGEDINVLVLDTEVYSNTGGQASKSTPTAAIAQFAAAGKLTKKKDLGLMATTYGYVYVAQIALGADKAQAFKAIKEAEAYDGPSLIIAYAPCINHGIRVGMGFSIEEEKKAVETGYWHLYRFNPELKAQGKNPFILDSKEPTKSFRDFLDGEVRYTSLKKLFPERAEKLYEVAEENAKERYENYLTLSEEE